MTMDSPRLEGYALLDQFDREHVRDDLADRTTLYVLAERAGAVALEQWATALHETVAGLRPALAVVPAMRLPGVPRLVRGAVRLLLPRDPNAWALLDWDDALAVLHVRGADCTVSVVAPDGRVVAREAVGLPDVDSVARLVGGATDAALDSAIGSVITSASAPPAGGHAPRADA
jgi:hypothetical protein